MAHELSPTARALVALEMIQNSPGVTAERLGERLGVTERAARRYVAILREAGVPIDAVSGRYGGYRVGRGMRLAPLMFTAAEATGLLMAVLEGHRAAADPTDLVGGALAKIMRVLPSRVASAVTVRGTPVTPSAEVRPVDPEITGRLIEACGAARRIRVTYQMSDRERQMEIDPWAVLLRHSRWYLLGWSHSANDRRALRIDRVAAVESRPETFTPPADLDALRLFEEHLSQGWKHEVDVLIDAPYEVMVRSIPRALGRLAATEDGRTRLRATTSNPRWYAHQLAAIEAPIHVYGSEPVRDAVRTLAAQLTAATDAPPTTEPDQSAPDGQSEPNG